jgi:SAM-dependent methyltransferase
VPDDPIEVRRSRPNLDRLDARFRAASPVFREAVARPRAALGDKWADEFDDTIERLFPGDDDIALAVDGYSRFALDVLRLQARFDQTGVYEARAYADVARDVYANDEYMRTCYLPGLLLSQYLWPHHHRQARFFEGVFLEDMRRAGAERFYDIGVGTGFYSRLALVGAPQVNGVGFDISPSSRDYAEHHASAFGAADRYRVELRDVLREPPEPVDWLVSVEVLEHLEDPVEFIRALRGLLRPGGKGFIATALNAPNADHIYLYRTADDVISQLRQGGFAVEQYFCALAGKPTRSDLPVAEVAAFIVT